MEKQHFDIVIVGAGIVGATLVGLLASSRTGQTPYNIALVEAKQPQGFIAGSDFGLRVSAISRASQRTLEQVGAWNNIASKRAHAYESMHVWDEGGSGEIRFNAAQLGEPDLGHIVENTVVQTGLLETLEALPGITLFCPASVTVLTESEQKARNGSALMELTLDSGECLQSTLIVGADGPSSKVRQLARIDCTKKDYGQHGLVSVVKPEYSHQDTAWQRFLPGGPLAFLPLGDGYCSIVWSMPSDQADRHRHMDDKTFCNALASAFDHKLGSILSCGPRAAFPLQGGQADSYIADGVALVGDAAHTIHPLAGQGVNLGIKDAAVLADILSKSPPGDWSSQRALRQYERSRKGENVMAMRVMEGFNVLFGHDAGLVKTARNIGLTLFNRAEPVKELLMKQAMGL